MKELKLTLLAGTLLLTACPETKVADDIFAPLGEPLPLATAEQQASFQRGLEVAKRRFTPEEGLGPKFNLTFCAGCHEGPVVGGGGPRYRNFLLVGSKSSDGAFVPTGVNGVQPIYDLNGIRVPTDAETNVVATRNAIPFFGVGLIAEIEDDVILANADPNDEDGDGISGRPNYDRGFVGRLGRKSQTVSVEGFIRGPLFNHLGITSNPLSDAKKDQLFVASGASNNEGIGNTVRGQAAAPDEPTIDQDGVPDPELSEDDLFDLVNFSMLMAAPAPEPETETTLAGQDLFVQVGCEGCHVRALEGPRGLIPLYSDLLLHDMGAELADGIPMKEATGSEFRTQPLWGIAAGAPYLHDGRADTIDEAIRFHGGEAEASRTSYLALTDAERDQILGFLNSLGGRNQASTGLLPPEAPIPEVGAFGGPEAALAADEETRFRRGREIFDRNIAFSAGLGPAFNGDSCRACHFDPVIGGSGPNDVNVVRHGYDDGQGNFMPPAIGTMAYRLGTAMAERALADPDATVLEARQTPAIFGLGAVERIPEANILQREDPMDLDNDGIAGIAHRLDDGRLGRFGWKANVPTLLEFARDALSAEVGLTVPAMADQTFGLEADGDEAADPEIGVRDVEDLTFFMKSLSPPRRVSENQAAETAGEAMFRNMGCDGCHVPSLNDADGQAVRLFSDLLLHDVAAEGALGIADGMATTRHFRTPPLWGLRETAPYMHDGSASTIEESIAAHFSEAEASRLAYEMATETERSNLLLFLLSL